MTVNIYGEQYTIVADESTSHVNQVASIVDDKMREMKSLNPYLDTKRLAVLIAVNTVSDYLKLEEKLDKLQQENEKKDGDRKDA